MCLLAFIVKVEWGIIPVNSIAQSQMQHCLQTLAALVVVSLYTWKMKCSVMFMCLVHHNIKHAYRHLSSFPPVFFLFASLAIANNTQNVKQAKSLSIVFHLSLPLLSVDALSVCCGCLWKHSLPSASSGPHSLNPFFPFQPIKIYLLVAFYLENVDFWCAGEPSSEILSLASIVFNSLKKVISF
jgi:hypothetical protein